MGREANKQDKLDRIRAAAAELFTTQGFDETSVAEVAARANVAKGTVFLYAQTKADLVALVFEEALREVTIDAVAELDPHAPLHAELAKVFSRFFGVYEPRPTLARLVLRELSFTGGQAARIRDELDRTLLGGIAAHVEARKAEGTISGDVVAMTVATNAFALYLLALLAWLSGAVPSRAFAEQYLAGSLELACRGLHLTAPMASALRRTPEPKARTRTSTPKARTKTKAAPRRRAKGTKS